VTPLGVRGVFAAVLVAGIVGVVFPYVTLRLGFGPNVSLLATLLGFAFLSLARARGRSALHAAHVAGVAAGQTAFMGIAFMAMELLRARHLLEAGAAPAPAAVFLWLCSAGLLGMLVALPLRRRYLDEEKLGFAAGQAAAETILLLEAPAAGRRAFALAWSSAAAAALTLARPMTAFGPLGVGSGMLLGLRVALSVALGAALARVLPASVVPWAASSLMVTGGLGAVLFRPRRSPEGEQPPLAHGEPRASRLALRPSFLLAAAGALAVLCAVDRVAFGVAVPYTIASAVLAVPLLVVGTRVLGETNWAPVLSLATVAQAVLAILAPGCVVVTMVGSAVAGAIPNGGQHLMQSLRAASILRAGTRETMIAQALGVVVGALALSFGYPVLVARAGLGEGGLMSPLSVSWAAFAETFAGGALAPSARVGLAGGAVAGLALTLLGRRFGRSWPGATALGAGMLLPGGMAAAIAGGALVARLLSKLRPRAAGGTPIVASGLIAGEALAACAAAVLR
jgi:uncharacterized oligopeptide transporter (OPT) family protein